MGSRGTKRRDSWWSRNMVFPTGLEPHGPSPAPMHTPRTASCVCPCASCYNNVPRPQSYLNPIRPSSSISGTSATLSVPKPARKAAAPRIETPNWERKRGSRSSMFGSSNRFSLLRRKNSYESLASDCAPLTGRGSPMGYVSDEMSVRY